MKTTINSPSTHHHLANTSPKSPRSTWLLPLLLLLATGALLGLSTNLAKLAGDVHLSPLSFLTWSVVGSTAVLLLVNAIRKQWATINRRTIKYFFVSGLVGVALPNLVFFCGGAARRG